MRSVTPDEADTQALEHAARWVVLSTALTLGALSMQSTVLLVFCALVDVSALRHLGELYRSTTVALTAALVAVPATVARYVLMDNPTDLPGLARGVLALALDLAVAGAGVWLMRLKSRL